MNKGIHLANQDYVFKLSQDQKSGTSLYQINSRFCNRISALLLEFLTYFCQTKTKLSGSGGHFTVLTGPPTNIEILQWKNFEVWNKI